MVMGHLRIRVMAHCNNDNHGKTMPTSSPENSSDNLADRLGGIVGTRHVLTDEASRAHYSRDLGYLPACDSELVVQPGTIDELRAVVGCVTGAGRSVIPRGGGMSYTGGYTPGSHRAVCIDTGRLDRIVEVNSDDRYVVVEAGCTWQALNEALKPGGLRTPFWGPFSGKYATVGGTLSQNAVSYGSGLYGTAADSVLGLQVVLADGRLVTTGAGAHSAASPFFRHFGPDMTGLFTADTGAFGIKATAVLKLIARPQVVRSYSYAFEHLDNVLDAQIEIARLQVASDCYCFDPYNNADFERKGVTFEQRLSIAGTTARRGLRGVWEATKMAMAGKKVLRGVKYSLHLTLPGHSPGVVTEHARLVDELCRKHGGIAITNTIPVAHQAGAFENLRLVMMGPDGDIWLPTHGIFPASRLPEAVRAFDMLADQARPDLDQHGIRTAYTIVTTGQEFLFEPFLYWHDEPGSVRLERIEPEFAEQWRDIPSDPARREMALSFREQIRDLFDQLGGLHLQLGRFYPYVSVIADPGLKDTVTAIKQALDPEGLMNPGSLELP
ncbi:MAG: hypothetical protein CMK32_06620 [Porticoccaceae bacterium]|nr:hypothetical protein [Porticoccaceae bacterium]